MKLLYLVIGLMVLLLQGCNVLHNNILHNNKITPEEQAKINEYKDIKQQEINRREKSYQDPKTGQINTGQQIGRVASYTPEVKTFNIIINRYKDWMVDEEKLIASDYKPYSLAITYKLNIIKNIPNKGSLVSLADEKDAENNQGIFFIKDLYGVDGATINSVYLLEYTGSYSYITSLSMKTVHAFKPAFYYSKEFTDDLVSIKKRIDEWHAKHPEEGSFYIFAKETMNDEDFWYESPTYKAYQE